MCRERKRTKTLVSATAQPDTIQVMETYCQAANTELVIVPEKDGKTDKEALKELLDDTTACFYVQQPNYYGLFEDCEELGQTLGEALLTPTRIYVKPVLRCMEEATVKGVSHITGGGFFENIPRCLPEGLAAKIDKAAIKTPPIFAMLQSMGSIPERDMFNTFNMGVGMTVIVSPDDADKAMAALGDAYVIGEIVESDERVILC